MRIPKATNTHNLNTYYSTAILVALPDGLDINFALVHSLARPCDLLILQVAIQHIQQTRSSPKLA